MFLLRGLFAFSFWQWVLSTHRAKFRELQLFLVSHNCFIIVKIFWRVAPELWLDDSDPLHHLLVEHDLMWGYPLHLLFLLLSLSLLEFLLFLQLNILDALLPELLSQVFAQYPNEFHGLLDLIFLFEPLLLLSRKLQVSYLFGSLIPVIPWLWVLFGLLRALHLEKINWSHVYRLP